MEIEATRIDQLLNQLSQKYNITVKELKSSVIFVNGKNIVHLKVFKTKLNDGDQVDMFTPAGGG